MRRLFRRLVVIGLHSDRGKDAAWDGGREGKRWAARNVRVVMRFSRRKMRVSVSGADGKWERHGSWSFGDEIVMEIGCLRILSMW